MVTRRALLLGSSAAALGAVAGCSAQPGPAGSTTAPAPAPSGATPSPSSTGSSPSASARPTATPTIPRHPTPVLDEVVAERLDVPWGLVFLSSGDALVGERGTARIRRVTRAGRTEKLGEVAGVVAPEGLGEGGLLGLALAPGDEDTLFACTTTVDDDRVVRVSLAGGRVGRPRVVLAGIPTSTHHHGGRLLFDAGGRLLVSTGDAEQSRLAQDRNSLAGKILRIRPDGRAAAGNPFDNRTWSYGHRNVEGLAFDEAGRLWATEFGDQEADELTRSARGGTTAGRRWRAAPTSAGSPPRPPAGHRRAAAPRPGWRSRAPRPSSARCRDAACSGCRWRAPTPAGRRRGWRASTGGCGRWPGRRTGRCG
ncbi:hypothetical protein GCM10009616_20060 [Microlunatus lacustris]